MTNRCQVCGDTLKYTESYQMPENSNHLDHGHMVCLMCWLDYKTDIAQYSTKGLHFGDNT